MKNKKKYSLNIGAKYNSKREEWDVSLGVTIDFEQENDSQDLLEASEQRCFLEDETN